ncbi:MAG: GGDEF domain-containing protein [Anaerolineae bacterium]|nr:GGDEF domain-containing protein [Phycisphaerae bacterium]
MLTLDHERILLIGDRDRQMHSALTQVLPGAHVTAVPSYFDGIVELNGGGYTTVLAAAEPIERRPEAAVRALRDLAGEGRVLLFGHPTLEPLSRKMLDFGCDDYIVTPISPTEIQQMFGSPPLRLTPAVPEQATTGANEANIAVAPGTGRLALLGGLPLAEIMLDAMLQHPNDAVGAVVRQINARIGPNLVLIRATPQQPLPDVPDGMQILSHALRFDAGSGGSAGALHLMLPQDEDEAASRHALAQISHLLGRMLALQDRHRKLQTLAITDDLTGVFNGRYFRHFLTGIINTAREKRFPVTLLLFDIDNFKSYNDRYGHGVGDEILKQTAALMRRCTRPHDLVARISGDEFAVVFWEKEGPRQPRDPNAPTTGTSRVPQSVRTVCDRFRRMISSPDFQLLGTTGQGSLTISGGLAVFPYDAQTAEGLIQAADRTLMFDAKKSGKNSIFLVGSDRPPEL